MPFSTFRRAPLAAWSLFLPPLAAIGLSLLAGPIWALLLLLLAQVLSTSASGQLLAAASETRWLASLKQRGLAHFVLLCGHTAVLYLVFAWPIHHLQQAGGVLAWLALAAALGIATAVLWLRWPAFGLIYLYRTTYAPGNRRSGLLSPLGRSLDLARESQSRILARGQNLLSCLTVLLPGLGALLLSGALGALARSWRYGILAGYGLILLPLANLLLIPRCQQRLWSSRHSHRPQARPLSAAAKPAARALEAIQAPVTSPAKPPVAATACSVAPPVTEPPARLASTPELEAGLLAAARAGQVETALELVEAGADPNTRPPAGERDQRPVLILASLLPDTRLLRALIAYGADVNQNCQQLTPLLAVTRDSWHGRPQAALMLVSNGADPQAADHDGNTPLHGAALSEDVSISALLMDAGASPNRLNLAGESPLVAACRAANWPQVRFLLERGARTAPADGVPALLAAAGGTEDDPQGVQWLLKHRASVNAVDNRHRSALMEAASEGHSRIAQALLAAGAKIDLCDRHGVSALMEAARTGALDIVQQLADAQADVRLRDRHGRDALIFACQSPHAGGELIRVLLALGAEPIAYGRDGLTAIDHAATAGRWDLLSLLDPHTPLPASLDHSPAADQAATPTTLYQALRQGRWPEVAAISTELARWPQAWLAQIYLELAHPGLRPARRWLLQHGLSPEARLAANPATPDPTLVTPKDAAEAPQRLGRRLYDALLKQLPTSAEAIEDLLHAGASPAGAGLLAQVLRHIQHPQPKPHDWLLRSLELGADPFGPDAQGRTPLHLAVANGQEWLVEVLLERGCNPNARDRQACTPLFAALRHNAAALPLIRLLICYGADPEAMNAHGETPLGLALDLPAIESWLNWSDWPLPGRRLRASDLPAAAAAGAGKAVAKLHELGFSIDARDQFDATALIHACGGGHLALVEPLLDAGADPTLATRQGINALGAAVRSRSATSLQLLLKRGIAADLHAADAPRALAWAAALGYPELIEILLQAGAAVNAVDAQGRCALHLAARYGFQSSDSLRVHRLLELLLRHGADPQLADQAGHTPLLLLLGADQPPGSACDATHLAALLPVLLSAGAAPDTADQRGVAPLHACAMHALLGPAKLLLTHGVDRWQGDNLGRSAAEIAYRLGYLDIAHELAGRGGNSIPSVNQTLRQPTQAAD